MSTQQTVLIDYAGYITAEGQVGETVTVKTTYADGTTGPDATGPTVDDGKGNPAPVTNPDGTVTPASITFLTGKVALKAGAKATVAVASVPDDSVDAQASSKPFTYDVPTAPRTIVLTSALQ